MKRMVLILAGASLLVGGCSTRPRDYNATLAIPPADAAAYDRDFAECRALVRSGKRSGFGPAVGATGAGVAAGTGVGAAAVATGAMPLGIVTTSGAAAAAAATLVLMPLAGIAAGVGVTKAIRRGKEKKVNAAMGECLAAHGHSVASWQLAKKARKAPAPAAAPRPVEAAPEIETATALEAATTSPAPAPRP